MRALDIIIDAYERCNRLSPGEILSADDAAFGFRRLTMLLDELSAQPCYLYKNNLTTAAQTGHITLGAGAWSALWPGDEIVSMVCDNLPLSPITIQQYNEKCRPAVTGTPEVYAPDGGATVYLHPTPNGQTITIQTRSTVTQFADQTTDYTLQDGWANALGAALAVRIAPTILGQIPSTLTKAEKMAMSAVSKSEPAIVDVDGYNGGDVAYPRRLF